MSGNHVSTLKTVYRILTPHIKNVAKDIQTCQRSSEFQLVQIEISVTANNTQRSFFFFFTHKHTQRSLADSFDNELWLISATTYVTSPRACLQTSGYKHVSTKSQLLAVLEILMCSTSRESHCMRYITSTNMPHYLTNRNDSCEVAPKQITSAII